MAKQETPETLTSRLYGHRQQLDEISSEEGPRSKDREGSNVAFVLENDDLTRLDPGREQCTTRMAHRRIAVQRQHGVEVIARRTARGIDKVHHGRSFAQNSIDVGRSTTNFDGRLPTCIRRLLGANLVGMRTIDVRPEPMR